MEVFKELGITQSIISRLWQQFQDDRNVSRLYNTDRSRVTTPNEDQYLVVTPKRNRQNKSSDLSCQLSATTDTTVSKQTGGKCLGHIGIYARKLLRRVLLMATRCL
ncbi:HTH_Tnp_Tc3_2 domain-containing protein [Trichonephila clavipes]|nr:HTH_Tnp_Tc3_2 domain-containing protein [Trichonephila clavipes]GFV05747.1 HTH_Tnp_Tc3_2 domain-containing protein [Trichonephila clavipes]